MSKLPFSSGREASGRKHHSLRSSAATRILLAVGIILSMCGSLARLGHAQAVPLYENYLYVKDSKTGQDIAVSLPDAPVNFMMTGNLKEHSYHAVSSFFDLLSNVAQIKLDPEKRDYVLWVFHDTDVFARLNNNRESFISLGIPAVAVDVLTQKAKAGMKCVVETFPGSSRDNLAATVVLLSEQTNECLLPAVFRAFGVLTGAPSFYAVISTCVLYDGRRAGVRELGKLRQEGRRLAVRCAEKAGS